MGLFADVAALTQQDQAAAGVAAAPSLTDDLIGPAKGAFYGLRAGAERSAATIKGAAGLDGSGMNRAADEDAAEQAANQPSIRNIGDVHSLGDAAHYAAGLVGGVAPILAGGAAGRLLGGAAGAFGGTAAAIAPTELGGQIDRAHADPANAGKSDADILKTAVPTAAATTALQSVTPGGAAAGVGKKIGMAERIAESGVQNAALGAGAEGVRQVGDNALNPDKGYDPNAIKDAAVEGGAQGAVFGAAHAAVHAIGGAAAKAAPTAFDALAGGTPEAPGGTPPADPARSVGGMIDGLHAKLSELTSGQQAVEGQEGQVKHSDDYTGTTDKIVQAVAPLLPPDVTGNADQLNKLGDVLRMTVTRMTQGLRVDSDSIAKLMDITGDKTVPVLEAVQQAVDSGDKKATEAFYGQLNAVHEVQEGRRSVTDLMADSLKPELKDTTTTVDLQRLASKLDDWAGNVDKGDPHQAEQTKFRDSQVRAELVDKFGAKADAVLDAVNATRKQEQTITETAGQTREKSFDDETSKTSILTKNKELHLHPDFDKGSNGFEGAASQALKKARAENPDAHVRFAKAEELGDHPAVEATRQRLVKQALGEGLPRDEAEARGTAELSKYGAVSVESTKQETALSKGDLDNVKLDTSKTSHAASKARLDTGDKGPIIDAVKLTEYMQRKLGGTDDFTSADNKDALARKARMFMEGVAAVQQQVGHAFEIPKDLVIDRKGTKWGDVEKKLKDGSLKMADHEPISGEQGETPAAMEKRLSKMRRDYAEAARKGAGDEHLAKLKEAGEALKTRIEDAHSAARTQEALEASGKTQADPKGTITEQGGKPAPLKTDEAGNTLKKSEAPLSAKEKAVGAAKVADTPAPTSVRAKREAQAAFVEKVKAADPETLKKLSTAKDPGSLQRVVDALIVKREKVTPELQRSFDVINKRLGELVSKDTQTAYSMSTKKFSMESDMLHAMSGKEGFGAAHDSSAKFEKFDWRKNAGKGEGQAFGAGTYLSSGDTTHRYYKARATSEAGETSPTYHLSVDIKPHELLNFDRKLRDQDPKVVGLMKAEGLDPDMTGKEAYRALSTKFGGDREASEYLQGKGVMGHEYSAANGKDARASNYVVYNDDRISQNAVMFDKTDTDATQASTKAEREQAYADAKQRLGPSVNVEWGKFLHAGEFERKETGKANAPFDDILRVSVHSLDPRSVMAHESMHAFFARVADSGKNDITRVLTKFAESAPIKNQLRELLKNHPEALKQLEDPEERAAYAFQYWQSGKLNVGSETHNVFTRIATFLKNVLGIWSNDQRALHIMEHFNSGEFAKGQHDMNAVHEALMESGRNKAVDYLKNVTEPLRHLGENLAVAGGARMRDSGIPALKELADSMKRGVNSEGADAGFLPTARAERSRMMNGLGQELKPFSDKHIAEAFEALKTGTKPTSSEARQARSIVRAHLDKAYAYLQAAGVKVGDLGVGKDYFPRAWDAGKVSSNQKAFTAMIQKYIDNGQYQGKPSDLMRKLMVTDGNEFGVQVDKPGMQFLKPRELAFIDPKDAAPFVKDNLYETMNSYMTQAARRAEWARRFGDDGSGVQRLYERAQQQGATSEQLASAKQFVRAVDGTLGDNLNPTARRLMGNMIVYQNLRLLPLAIFSSVVDPLGLIVRGGTVKQAGSTFVRGIKEMTKNFSADPKDDDATKMAQLIGTIDNAMLQRTLGASYSQGMVGSKARAINDTFFRLNLMEQFNNSMRVGATEAAMDFIQRHAAGENAHSARYMNELGLTKADVKVDKDGQLNTDSPQMKMAINRWVDGAVLRPDAVDKPAWMSDPHFALISHLKQFVFAFHETILKRVAHEAANGNYTPAMALATYAPVMVAADMAKALIQGGGSMPASKQDWGPEDWAWDGVQRGGLLGSGQFAADALGDIQKGGSGFGAVSGPTIEQLSDGVRTLGGNEQFKTLAINAMPANALYKSAVGVGGGRSHGDDHGGSRDDSGPMFAD